MAYPVDPQKNENISGKAIPDDYFLIKWRHWRQKFETFSPPPPPPPPRLPPLLLLLLLVHLLLLLLLVLCYSIIPPALLLLYKAAGWNVEMSTDI